MHFHKLALFPVFAMTILLSQMNNCVQEYSPYLHLEGNVPESVRYKIKISVSMSIVALANHFTEGSKTLLCPAIEHIENALKRVSLELDRGITQFAKDVHGEKPKADSGVLLQQPHLWVQWIQPYLLNYLPTNQPRLLYKFKKLINHTSTLHDAWQGKAREFLKKKEGSWVHTTNDKIEILPDDLSLNFDKGGMFLKFTLFVKSLMYNVEFIEAVPIHSPFYDKLSQANSMVPYFMVATYLNSQLTYCETYSQDTMHWVQPRRQSRVQSHSQVPSHTNEATPSQAKIPLIFNDHRGILECAYFDVDHDGREVIFSTTEINDFFKMDRDYLQDRYEKLKQNLAQDVKSFDKSIRAKKKFRYSPYFASQFSYYKEGDTNATLYFTETYFKTLFEAYPLLESYNELNVHLSHRYSRLILMHNSIPQAIQHFVTKLENREADPSVGWNKELTGIGMKLTPNKIAFIEFEPVFDYTLFDRLILKGKWINIFNNNPRALRELKLNLQQHERYLTQWTKLTFYKTWFNACKLRI